MFKTFLIIVTSILLCYNFIMFTYHSMKASNLMIDLEKFIYNDSVSDILKDRTKLLYLKNRHNQIVKGIWCIILLIALILNSLC